MGNAYFSGVEKRTEQAAEKAKMARVVVAMQDMAFGSAITQQNVRLAAWPADSVPQGAFTSIDEVTKNRVALRPIVIGEPVLASKVSGANGRATLSANLPEGMLAFTVKISADSGVGGYVRPGDIVDVLLTRQIPGDGADGDDKMTDVVLQAVPVLGIDLISDEQQTKAQVGKTATLQVTTQQAQKLALATKVGALDLALRNVADQTQGLPKTVVPRDLTVSKYYIPAKNANAAPRGAPARPAGVFAPPRRTGPSMTVVRGVSPTEYEVRHGS
ncbi:Flp pilus assembly protein CpaB [Novosphingobium sp. 2580]|uniref:Flp pilus assembly protein CpaB n=2 Tax=Novosphingobium album (ex Hu et al. 2023) TaxID=2930093 RepID=A0ABT0B1F1_9SPHN|nr:Flp pilus assembly protein CpaB [Novosphingobium album (ex Hu et al. 2023)]